MENFLTTKQVIELLNIDRTTLYRMLKDGRLMGVKVGSQWRFNKDVVEKLISDGSSSNKIISIEEENSLPLKCIVPIQEVFADVAQIGVLLTKPNGEQITEISNSCKFCNLILDSEKGYQGCVASWERLSHLDTIDPKFVTCHAGLNYAGARIKNSNKHLAMFIAGQFYSQKKDSVLEKERVKNLAYKYNINEQELLKAAKEIRVLEKRWVNKIVQWLIRISNTFEAVIKEREGFLRRFEKIMSLSSKDLMI